MKKDEKTHFFPRLTFWKTALLVVVFAFGAYFRFIDLASRVPLGDETVRDAVVGIVGAREFQMPITGPFLSAGSFTVGPWYWNHLILGSFLFRSVYGPWIMVGIMSMASMGVLFLLGYAVFGYTLGLTMAIIAALSPPQIISSIHLTNPNTTVLYSSLVVYLFAILATRRVSKWCGFLFGVCLAMPVNMHFSAYNLWILILGIIIWSKDRWKQLLATMTGIFVVFIPLLFFNLLNHWHTARNMWDYLIYGRTKLYVPNSWTLYIKDFWVSFFSDAVGLSKTGGIIVAAAAAIALAIGIVYYKNKLLTKITIMFGILFILLRYYWGERFFTYFTFFQPFIFLASALPFALCLMSSSRWIRYGAIGVLAVYLWVVWPVTIKTLQKPAMTEEGKRVVMSLKTAYPNTPIALYNCKNEMVGRDHTLMFLLEAEGIPSQNGMRIGFADESCASADLYPALTGVEGMVNLSGSSQSALLSVHWTPLTFPRVYDIHTKWWYEEKP